MGYMHKGRNQWVPSDTPAGTPSGVIGATANSAAIEVAGGTVRMAVNVTAISGAGASLAPTLQTSHDAGVADAWRALPASGSEMPARTATGVSPYRTYAGADRFIRIVETVGGTAPSITRSYDIEAI